MNGVRWCYDADKEESELKLLFKSFVKFSEFAEIDFRRKS